MDVPAPGTSHATHRVADHMSKLAFLFPLGLDGKATRTLSFEDADFNLITEVLRTLDLPSWGTIPRTYTVLRMVNRIDDIDAFTTLKLSDLSIPYSKDNLPQSLSLSTKAKFIQTQRLVLTSSMDLERGESGGHKHISSLEDLQFERIADLGRGGGCTHVEKVWSNVGQKHYAVKYIRRAQYFQHDRKALKDFESELQNAKKVAHHHVVKIVGSFTEPLSVGIIMGTIGEQNLAQLLRGVVTSDTRSLLRTYFGCLASGLFAIHQADIKHKDIKPENVIIRKSVVYLTDFGLALDFSTTPENRSTTFGKPSVKHTPLYSAPEWWDYSRRDRRSDIWSLGAVYLEIATVLYNETIPNLFDFLGQHGSQNVLSYSRNMPAVWEWIEILRSKQGHEKDTVALDLTLATMQERIEERPTSYELWNLVERLSPPDVSFACRACVESFNPSEKEIEEPDPQPPTVPEPSLTLSAAFGYTFVTEPSTTIETLASPSSLLAQKQSLSAWDRVTENDKLFGIETNNDENTDRTKVDTSILTYEEQLLLNLERWREDRFYYVGLKLPTPIPSDLIPIIAKDPAKRKEIQWKALHNAENSKAIAMKDPKIPYGHFWQISREKDEQQYIAPAVCDQTYKNGNQTEMITKSLQEAAGRARLMELLESTKHLAIPAENGAGGQSINQGPWTIREDAQLIRAEYVSKPGNWHWISAVVGSRTTGQCKRRWRKFEVLFENAEGTEELIHVLEGTRSLRL